MHCSALVLSAVVAAGAPATATTVRQAGEQWTLANDLLRVELDTTTGALRVVDQVTGAAYRQPDSVRDPLQAEAGTEVLVLRAAQPITLDGRADEWAGTRLLRLDSTLLSHEQTWQSDGDADLSAVVGFRWDDQKLYALFLIADDRFVPGSREQEKWWEADSVEFWSGWDQVGYLLDPAGPAGFAWGKWQDWATAAVRPVDDFATDAEALALAAEAGFEWRGRSGYIAECAANIGVFITLQPVAAGRRFRLAAGVNDADEPGKRSAQLYYPGSWVHSRTSTYAVGVLADENGQAPRIPDGRPAPCGEVEPAGEDGLTYVLAGDLPEATVGRIRCTLRLPEGARDLSVASASVEGWQWGVPLFRGFLPEQGLSEYVVPLYGNGLLIPSDNLTPPVEYLGVFSSLDLPAVGVTGEGGSLLCLFDTYDYLAGSLRPATWDGRARLGLVVQGETRKGERLPEYRTTWHFAPEGGYAALAKRLREYCREQGWVLPLTQKRERNPNLDRLRGAPDVWGASGLAFAQEARAAGIRRLLVSGEFPPEQVRGMVDLGYLCGPYDQYVDTDETTESVEGVAPIPGAIRVEPDGSLAQGWVTLDGSHSWYSRCSGTALQVAQQRVPKSLAERPYNARFEDVHTAMGLVECYSPGHPCTRSEDRQNKTELLQWIRDQGLVLGGEHGRAWSAPVLDYQEGMMSCNFFFSWPAGHLVKVEREDQLSDTYLEWGIGFQRRVPFWELVFHDCVVSTWYWGDSIGYFERVRPDLTDRKVAMTALYGTIPLLWATDLDVGFQGQGKERFLEAYRNCCLVHEAVGYEAMVSHEFLTPDRAVQRTTFADGTTVTVNFGPEPAVVTSGGREWRLPTNGIVADGPRVHQRLALQADGQETYIECPGYRFLDGHGVGRAEGGLRSDGPLTAELLEPGHMRLYVEPATRDAALEPGQLDAVWRGSPARLVRLGPDLRPLRDVPLRLDGGSVRIPADGEWAAFDLLYGEAVEAPDVGFLARRLPRPEPVRQGETLRLRVPLRNWGGAEARVTVSAYWDRATEERLAGRERTSVPGSDDRTVELALDTSLADGQRDLVLVAEAGRQELVAADNQASVPIEVLPDFAKWPTRLGGVVDLAGVARRDAVVESPVDLTPSLGGAELDLASVRVALARADGGPERLLPSQFEPAEAAGSGTLLFILPGQYDGQQAPEVVVLAAPAGGGRFLAPAGEHVDPAGRVITRERYRADASTGALRPVWFLDEQGEAVPMLRRVIFSSEQTGWGEDGGTVEAFDVLADGPVRTRVRTVKRLPSDVVVTRTCDLYPGYFVVEAAATELCTGLFGRVWYAAPGTYEDNNGHRCAVDGQGDEEGVTGDNPDPKWYCMRSEAWAHACIALSPFVGQSYWDAGEALGQLGFLSARTEGNRFAHVITGPQQSAEFAREWSAALTQPPALRLRQ